VSETSREKPVSETSREAASEKRPSGLDSRQAKSTTELTDEEMKHIRAARTPAEHDYDYEEDSVPPQHPGVPS
jgi:hypothetical protein